MGFAASCLSHALRFRYWWAAGASAIVAALAYHAIPDLPLAPQSDEPKKADFILGARPDFLQPLLLQQTVRFVNLFVRHADQVAVVELGRAVAAAFGGLTVLATIVLARRVVGLGLALAAGVLAATTPLVAFHAQLFKEDIFLTPWLIFGLAALDRLRDGSELRRALAFGIATGLAASAKYVGAILLPFACLLPAIVPMTGASLRRYYAGLAASTLTAAAVFALVDAPAMSAPSAFVRGLDTEIRHALSDHIIAWRAWNSWFLFHWTTSLWPGLAPALATAGLGGAIVVVVEGRSSPPAIRLVLAFTAIWYMLHELSPMKPFMAIERHMTVIGGLFAILAVYLVARICRPAVRPWRAAVAAGMIAAIAAPAAISTIAIARSAANDTRTVVETIRASLDGRDSIDWYATFPAYRYYPPLATIDAATEYVVLAQEVADRFVQSDAFAGQTDRVRSYARSYRELLARPAIVVELTAGSFSVPQRTAADRCLAQHGGAAGSRAGQGRAAAPDAPHAGAGPCIGSAVTAWTRR